MRRGPPRGSRARCGVARFQDIGVGARCGGALLRQDGLFGDPGKSGRAAAAFAVLAPLPSRQSTPKLRRRSAIGKFARCLIVRRGEAGAASAYPVRLGCGHHRGPAPDGLDRRRRPLGRAQSDPPRDGHQVAARGAAGRLRERHRCCPRRHADPAGVHGRGRRVPPARGRSGGHRDRPRARARRRELVLRVREILDVDTCAVLLLDEARGELVARAAAGLEEEVESGVRIPLGRGFAGRVGRGARAVVVPDVDHADILELLETAAERAALGLERALTHERLIELDRVRNRFVAITFRTAETACRPTCAAASSTSSHAARAPRERPAAGWGRDSALVRARARRRVRARRELRRRRRPVPARAAGEVNRPGQPSSSDPSIAGARR